MTLEELQQQVDRDFKLDDTELDTESTKIPLLAASVFKRSVDLFLNALCQKEGFA